MAEPGRKRSRRSLKASEKGIAKAELALMHKGWSRNWLETEVGLSRSTIGNFFTGLPIDRLNFLEICKVLDLNWQEIAARSNSSGATPNTDPVVSAVTVEQREKTQEQSRTIQVLAGTTEQQVACEYTVGQQTKFYIYISQTKIDMLYSQLPLVLKKDSEAEQSMPAKIAVVCRYIENHEDVGTIKEPRAYISGTFPLKYGIVTDYASDIAYFGSVIDGQTLSLIGASASFVGAVKRINSNHTLYYYTLKFLNRIANANSRVNCQPCYYSFKEASEIALKCVPSEKYNLEFLAKVVYSEQNLVVATPFYVALA